MQENVSRECKKSLRWVHTQNFTFTDSVQSLSLHFVFVSQGHGVKRGTAQDGRALLRTAGYLSSWATNTDKVQTPSALSALLPGAYRLGTYTYTKGTNTKKLGLKQRGRTQTHTHTHVVTVYTHIIDVKAPKKSLTQECIKEALTTKSHSLLHKESGKLQAIDIQEISESHSFTHMHSDTAGDKVLHLL